MVDKKIRIRIVTPVRQLYDKEVDMVIIRGSEGDLGIMSGHQAITTALGYGIMKIKNDGEEIIAIVFGGFAEINPNQITILSDAAEWPDEIDVKRAEDAKERAEKRLKSEDIDVYRAELSLRRALVRIEGSNYKSL